MARSFGTATGSSRPTTDFRFAEAVLRDLMAIDGRPNAGERLMPTTLPAPIVARRPYGLLRTAALVVLLLIARLLFSASMRIVDFANGFMRRG